MVKLNLYCNGRWMSIHIDLPEEQVSVLQCPDPDPEIDAGFLLRSAMEHPVDALPLAELAAARRKAAVLFDDFTRPTPVSEILPPVLDSLAEGGIRRQDVVLVCANGMHAPDYMNEARLRRRVGGGVFDRFEVISHDAYAYEGLTFLGITRTLGTPLFINRRVAEADLKIAVGRIAPHGDVGYSGGAKMIMSGVSGVWSIIHHHTGSRPRRGDLHNPLRDDIEECGRLAGLDYIVNVVCNSRRQVLRVFAGDPVKARRSGIAYGDSRVWGVPMGPAADVVLVSPGPENERYFMSSMAPIGTAVSCLAPGGTIIIASSCHHGWTSPEYLESGWHVSRELLEFDYPKLRWMLAAKAYHEPRRQFQALVYYVNHIVATCRRHRVVLAGATGISRADAEKIPVQFQLSVQGAVMEALHRYGAGARVAVIKDVLTLPLQRLSPARSDDAVSVNTHGGPQ